MGAGLVDLEEPDELGFRGRAYSSGSPAGDHRQKR
jgi:hypothetical protein